ncbi:carboxypeptidase N subunit 2-like [Homarus americanus]|uniref:Leucine-rich repeat-containing G-protein coupled receptor 4-like 1 n=1 Tax=Homarus americanus TaxID=6706 RepID=A0A8J5K0I1_HOMAM|nr:carboxypeptidase N subunit 2-like [Homarus americanus]KAG7167852.1 Leucine-rich repeat-containing G-protein coupled receptor 4-like 1 [Homarus americanus]
MMADYTGIWWRVMALILALSVMTSAQRTKSCDVQGSVAASNKVDVHCDCMQRLTQMNLAIAHLTINQTSCSNSGLELRWPDLEALVSPDTFTVVGAHIYFSQSQPNTTWNSSISRLYFIDSTFEMLPAHAFRGMGLLEEVKFFGGSIVTIRSNAFSGLQKLKLIEIANSTVETIEREAFNNLESLEDLAFVHTSIGIIESEAVSLLKQNKAEVRCVTLGTRPSGSGSVIQDLMGRQLTSTGNISLPEYGSRLLLLKNNIKTLKSRAITSETLGFLIVGGNHIENVESLAFSMELYNECEISAALFVGNTFNYLGNSALAGLKGRDGVSYQTFIALAQNTFLNVTQQGFLLSQNLVIFTVDENKFRCVCDGFNWILSNPDSQNQQELEKELVLKATCIDGTYLISYTSSCTDHGTVTTPSARPPVMETSGASTMSFFSVSTSVITFVLARTLN